MKKATRISAMTKTIKTKRRPMRMNPMYKRIRLKTLPKNANLSIIRSITLVITLLLCFIIHVFDIISVTMLFGRVFPYLFKIFRIV